MNKKKAALIALSLALLTGCSSQVESHVEIQKEKVKKIEYKSFEDMWFNSPNYYQESQFDINSQYLGAKSNSKGELKFLLNTDDAYGDMLCRITIGADTFGSTDYIEVSGPYESDQLEYTVTIDMYEGKSAKSDNGTPWESFVECMLHPVK